MTGGFYAKYATTSSGSDSARVAKFDIKIDDTQGKFVTEILLLVILFLVKVKQGNYK